MTEPTAESPAGGDDDGRVWTAAEASAAAALWPELGAALERDALLERLARADWPAGTAFFEAVLQGESDPALQHAAAVALVQRSHPAGLAHLTLRLGDEDPQVVEAAASVLAAELGPASYAQLAALWGDEGRDRGVRRAALSAMAVADAPRARAELVALLRAAADDLVRLPDEDTLEEALWVLAEGNAQDAVPVLAAVRARLAASDESGGAREVMVAALEGILQAPADG